MEEKFTKSCAIKRIAELIEENTRLNKQIKFLENEYKIRINSYKEHYEKQLAKQAKQIVERIIEEYNLKHEPIQNEFGDTLFGYATINADKLKEFLDNLLKE